MTAFSLTETLAQHLLRPIDPVARGRARLHLLDWLGCVAGTLGTPVAAIARSLDDEPAAARAALLGNVLEMDDVHRAALLHPGPVVWPAALRLAGSYMTELLDAGVRGYEATIAVGATFDARHYAHWHNSATAGTFGAAATAAALLGCDAVETVSALGLAGSVAGGLWRMRHEPVTAKQWHIHHAVETGLRAARHARRGITGPVAILEGAQGLHAATCESPRPMKLGVGWRIDEVSFKPWAACRHAHPAIDAALALRETGSLKGPILIETYRDALTFCDRPSPTNAIEAKFSLQHAVSVVAERGEPALADFEPDAIAALAARRAAVEVREAADISARFPAHFGARVTVDGRTVERIDTLGDPERPLPRDGIVAKARALMAWGGVGNDADRAVDACLEGDDPGAVRALLERWL